MRLFNRRQVAPVIEVGQPAAAEGGARRPRDWQKVVGAGRGVLLAIVVLAPEAAAWQGLLSLARNQFHIPSPWEFLVPLLFGAAAFYVALLAQRYVLRGDSAITERLLTWAYAAAGAGFNFWNGQESGQEHATAVALFFGGASLSAALLWDRTLRAWRRDQLREIGALERPLPRFRALRWVLAPTGTFKAFRVSVLAGLSTPAEALAMVESRGQTSPAPLAGQAELAADVDQRPAHLEERPAVEPPPVLAPIAEEPPVAAEPTEDAPAVPDATPEAREAPEAPVEWNKAAAARQELETLGLDLDVDTPTTAQLTHVAARLTRPGRDVTPKYVREVARRQRLAADKRATARPVRLVAGAR